MSNDRNFDDLAHRFTDNIYGSPKGQIRLAILKQDLDTFLARFPANTSLRVLDAGCGLGYMALYLAEQGHEVVLCDHSAEMIQRAQQMFAEHAPKAKVSFIESSVQEVNQHVDGKFDLVLFHAVLEWVSQPQQVLQQLLSLLQPQGYLSLLFYNRNSLVFRNMLRGNFRKVASEQFAGDPGSLTPSNPLMPEDVYGWLASLDLSIITRTGVRILYDYLPRDILGQRSFEDILDMERRHCHQSAFIDLGRYIHVLSQLQS